ncbi:short-chain dehydrogenase [Xylaria cubensis]|nr:short-chain dehydrogenase [Xylaria cubensis]
MDMSALFRVDGMVAIITGGGTGIGQMMAKALANAGAKVYILGRRASALEAAAVSTLLNRVVFGYLRNLRYFSGVLVIRIMGPYTSYDSTLSIHELRTRLFDQISMEDFTDTMHVNATAAYFTILAFLELLDAGNKNALKGGFGKPQEEGSKVPLVQSQVIVTSSICAYSREKATAPAYGASKSAITQLAQHAATNLAPYQIRVNTLAPGFFMSEMAEPIISLRDPETEGIDHPDFMPARRFGTEEELAGTILYLASKAGAYCNGAIFNFDGGRLAVVPSTY